MSGRHRKNGYPKILKPHFKLNREGKLEVEALTSLNLDPGVQLSDTFYPIRNDILVEQPGLLGTIHWAIGQSIVPIVEISKDHESVRCLGTGFYIHTNGLMITAAHVLTEYLENAREAPHSNIDMLIEEGGTSRVGVMLATNPILEQTGFEFLPFRWSYFFAQARNEGLPWQNTQPKLLTDVALCQTFGSATGKIFQPLAIIQPGMKGLGSLEGRKVFAVGYSGMEDFTTIAGNGNNTMKFVPHLSNGEVARRILKNAFEKAVPSPGPCIEIGAAISSGMSGSPIFDEEGIYVHGVASSSWQGEHGELMKESYCSMIAPVCATKLAVLDGKSLHEILRDQSSGMIKIHAPGDM